jgi:hypothetical protein
VVQSLSSEVIVTQLLKKFPAFLEPASLLPCSQPTTAPCPELDESILILKNNIKFGYESELYDVLQAILQLLLRHDLKCQDGYKTNVCSSA